MKKLIYFLICFLLYNVVDAQANGELKGHVSDTSGTNPLSFVTVQLFQDSIFITGAVTDKDGDYLISGISPGTYVLIVKCVGYADYGYYVKIKAGTRVYHDVKMYDIAYTPEDEFVIKGSGDDFKQKLPEVETTTDIDIRLVGSTSATDLNKIMDALPEVYRNAQGQLTFRGARASQTGYYLGPMPMLGSINFSPRSLSQLGSMVGGISSEFGDFIGGAVVQNIQSPSAAPKYTVEYMTSSLFDKYHFNQLDFTASGPLIKKRVKSIGKDRMVLGYLMNFNYRYQADPNPSGIGVWKLKDAKLKEIEENPILKSPGGSGYIPRAELITADDLEKVSARQNADANRFLWVGKLDYRPSVQSKIEFSWVMNHAKSKIAPFSSSLLNAASNPIAKSQAYIGILNYEQNLLTYIDSNRRSKSDLTRLRYSISAHYQHFASSTEDAVHGRNYFDYGYVGQFNSYRAPVYDQVGDESPGGQSKSFVVNGDTVWLKNFAEHSGYADTLYTFDRSHTKNPLLANYTSAFYDAYGKVSNLGEIRNSSAGLVNGMNPIGVYSNMWTNVGTVQVGSSMSSPVGQSSSTQYSINAKGEVSWAKHNVKLGMYMEQRVYRAYQVNAMGLWQLMYQSANSGLVLDKENPILQYNSMGVFQDTVRYNEKFNSEQTSFSKRLREELIRKGAKDVYGNPITANSYVDIHSLRPEDFSLDMFTADELLGTGGNNQYVNYYGYDYLGRKNRGSFSLNDFFNNPKERKIGAFKPIYAAAYVEDVLEFKDLIIRMGLRVERFDANQPVLKDPYSLYPVRTAGEVKELNGKSISHPDAIGEDYAVYVDDIENPKAIVGYRKDNEWFNQDGLRINDPAVLTSKTKLGTIQPYLVDADNQNLTAASFKDYKARTLVLPRFAVDFPLSSEVKLYANYSVLAQRPSNIFTPVDDYYFLKYNPTQVLNNPDLKPQITTDYEIGIHQLLTEHVSFRLSASYREQRNMIQLRRFNYAYPFSYTSYANIDFATVKGVSAELILRNRHIYMNANYTFQIADGTGSGTSSQQGLVSAGQPNLRSLFPLDNDIRHNVKLSLVYDFANKKEYAGPIIKGKRILENAGVNINFIAFSGVPYTANLNATANVQRGVVQRSPILGTPNGSRLPWQLENNLNIYKMIPVKLGKKDGAVRGGELTFSLMMENFLNIKNIQFVHPYTGSASTDGYLSSATGQAAVESAVNAQSFVDLYNTALNNPGYYGLPRRTRISVMLSF